MSPGRLLGTAMAAGVVASLAGCGAGVRMQGLEQEVAELKARISSLEGSLGRHEESLRELAEAKAEPVLIEPATYSPPPAPRRTPPNKPRVRHIQEALRNAGFSPGRIDNKLGPRTKGAIKRFQKANRLRADGLVGTRTWGKLKYYY